MNADKEMRQEVKKYIDTADVKVIKMLHAMLEVDAETEWWDAIPDTVKLDIDAALIESENGDIIPHEEIKKQYQKWIVK